MDWRLMQVKDLKPFVTSGSRGWATYYSDKGAPFIRITNLSRSNIFMEFSDLRLVDVSSGDAEATRTALQDGDVLISITADIGIVGNVTARLAKPAYINQHIALVRFDQTQTNPRFVSYFLASERMQKHFRVQTDSGAKAGMSLSTVQKIQIALPPTIAEQEAIANALSDADALIESLEQLITKKRHIKQGAMQELLTGKKRLAGFSGSWKCRSLRSCLLANPDYGINAAGVPMTRDLPTYLRITDIDDDGRFVQFGRVAVDNPLALNYYLNENELVFARTGASVGKTYRYKAEDGKVVFAGYLIRVKVDSKQLLPAFLDAHTRTQRYWNWVRVMSMRSGQPGINGNEYATLMLPLPPTLEEQLEIAKILTDMDTELVALEQKLTKARQIKQGMMANLLTGKIRLV
jgi:type I restriction enzyme, S subunit